MYILLTIDRDNYIFETRGSESGSVIQTDTFGKDDYELTVTALQISVRAAGTDYQFPPPAEYPRQLIIISNSSDNTSSQTRNEEEPTPPDPPKE